MLYIRDGEPLTLGSLSDPLADFSDPFVVSKTAEKTVTNIYVMKSLSAYAVALKTYNLLFTPISLLVES